VPLLRGNADTFVSYDLFTEATLHVTFEKGPSGEVRALVVHANDGDVRAGKESTPR